MGGCRRLPGTSGHVRCGPTWAVKMMILYGHHQIPIPPHTLGMGSFDIMLVLMERHFYAGSGKISRVEPRATTC
jgi:hypothetical protein